MRVVVLAFLLAFAADFSSASPVEVGTGKADGNHFSFKVSDAEIHNTPWWTSGAKHHAVPPRSAIDIARKQLKEFVVDGDKWRLDASLYLTSEMIAGSIWSDLVASIRRLLRSTAENTLRFPS